MQKYKGMTFIGMLLAMVVTATCGLLLIRVVPVYIEHYTLIHAVKSLNSVPISSLSGDPIADVEVLKSSLFKNFDVNGLEQLKEDQLHIIPEGDYKYKIKINYQVIKPLVYNISLMFQFDETQEVIAGSEH